MKKADRAFKSAALYLSLKRDPAQMNEHERKNWGKTHRILAPLFSSLHDEGIQVKDAFDLEYGFLEDKDLYRKALKHILEFLPKVNDGLVIDLLAGTLRNKWASPQAIPILIKEFQRVAAVGTPLGDSTAGWRIGDVLSYLAQRDCLDDIINLFSKREYGSARQMLATPLAKFGKGNQEVVRVLIRSLSDEDVAGHAIVALGKMRAKEARNSIIPFLSHKNSWLRNSARNALKKIEEAR